MPSGEDTIEGESITFENVNRKHIGIYECMASNNVGDPATSSVEVEVKCEYLACKIIGRA